MEIKNFDKIRAGEFPVCIDVEKIGNHSNNGLISKVYLYKQNDGSYVQIRKHNKHEFVFIATFKFDDMELPDHYQDSIILYDSRK